MEVQQFAGSTLQLLQNDPSKYKLFGAYWYLVKGVLKHFYTKDNLFMLGEYVDQSVIDRMPEQENLTDALVSAAEEFQHNVMFGLPSGKLEDKDGEIFTFTDTDAE